MAVVDRYTDLMKTNSWSIKYGMFNFVLTHGSVVSISNWDKIPTNILIHGPPNNSLDLSIIDTLGLSFFVAM